MPSSYTNLLCHIIFSTKLRHPWITETMAPRMHAYLGGAIRSGGGTALIVGGQPDHIHILARFRPDAPISKVVGQMKANGVKFEVCDYALKVMDVDPKTILPEIDHVPNGFISIAGYQAQGYSLITIN